MGRGEFKKQKHNPHHQHKQNKSKTKDILFIKYIVFPSISDLWFAKVEDVTEIPSTF